MIASYLVKPLTNPEYSHRSGIRYRIGYWWVGNDISAIRDRKTWDYRVQSSVFCADLSYFGKQTSPILFNSRCY